MSGLKGTMTNPQDPSKRLAIGNLHVPSAPMRDPVATGADSDGENRRLDRFRAKACPALDAGWIPVRVKKARQNKNLEPRSDSIGTEEALAAGKYQPVP